MLTNCQRSCNNCFGEVSHAMEAAAQESEHRRKGQDFGVAQILYASDGTREADIQWILKKARNYMTTVVPWKFHDKMGEICQNQHEQCAYWAFVGACTTNAECKF